MAFNVKKSKRLPPPPPAVPADGKKKDTNVVATHSWVHRTLKKFFDWTKFFATESAQVAGGLKAGRIQTNEIKTGDAYATRLTLVDPSGRPAVLYIDEKGNLQVKYDFKDVYVYPGNGDIEIKSFVYRGLDIAANFVGLTPYETFLNFIPFESTNAREFNGKPCFRLCSADGKEDLVEKTLLVTCNQARKIVAVKIWDSDGEETDTIVTLPTDRAYRKLTINMPSFCDPENENQPPVRVNLPVNQNLFNGNEFKPFVPPFLLPPKPHPGLFFPPTKPTIPPKIDDSLFDDQVIDDADDLFADLGNNDFNHEPQDESQQFALQPGYDVQYEDYQTNAYVNVTLTRDDFEQNKEQFLVIETADA